MRKIAPNLMQSKEEVVECLAYLTGQVGVVGAPGVKRQLPTFSLHPRGYVVAEYNLDEYHRSGGSPAAKNPRCLREA